MRKINRTLSRELAMELIYREKINPSGHDLVTILQDHLEMRDFDQPETDVTYIRNVITLVSEHETEINQAIDENLESWTIDRLSKVNLSILEVASAEILYMDDIPSKVSINEALNLTKKFSDEKDKGFINKVLDNIAKKVFKGNLEEQ